MSSHAGASATTNGGRGGGGHAHRKSTNKHRKPKPDRSKAKVSTVKREKIEIQQLQKRIDAEAPPSGSQDIPVTTFAELPICRYTFNGLQKAKFSQLTEIQRCAIPHALAGRDILGAAKTGSGKTLAFLVPVLEKLFHTCWSAEDGLGALIISPTRELAMQIMEVLKTVANYHYSVTAGLICGGKDFAEEQLYIQHFNILIATPGRLLQHMEQTPEFEVNRLQMLVLDEADRILDMGFKDTMDSIIQQLPVHPQRQTLLFSATQTKDVKQLARLSLKDPEYLAVHSQSDEATPTKLVQTYVVSRLEDKLNVLYSFIKTHLKNKSIVFVSSCKQVRFLFEAFRRIRPGVPLLHLHGKMKQERRMYIYYDFLKKNSAVMFATDIAARGLDFPNVDWVLQLDCPEDPESYVHRVGRTARFLKNGNSLLVLLPSEAPVMVPLLKQHKIPLRQIKINSDKAVSVTNKIAAEVAADTQLKQTAQGAFRSYLRSIMLQPNKEVFDVNALPVENFSESLGLANTPSLKFLRKFQNREKVRELKNKPAQIEQLKKSVLEQNKKTEAQKNETNEEEDESGISSSDSDSSEEKSSKGDDSDSSDEDNDDDQFLNVKRTIKPSEEDDTLNEELYTTEDMKGLEWYEKQKLRKATESTKELRDGKDGPQRLKRIVAENNFERKNPTEAHKSYTEKVKEKVQQADATDKGKYRERIREKHREEKRRARGIEGSDSEEGQEEDHEQYRLPSGDEDEEEGNEEESQSNDKRDDSSVESDEQEGNVPSSLEETEDMAMQLLKRRRIDE